MNRGDVGLVLGLAGFLLGGFAVYVATATRREFVDTRTLVVDTMKSDDDNLAGMGAKLKDLGDSHKALTERVSRLTSDPNKLWDSIHALESRAQKLESAHGVRMVEVPNEPPTDKPK